MYCGANLTKGERLSLGEALSSCPLAKQAETALRQESESWEEVDLVTSSSRFCISKEGGERPSRTVQWFSGCVSWNSRTLQR